MANLKKFQDFTGKEIKEKVLIRVILKDGFGNRFQLIAKSNEFRILHYSLSLEKGGIGHSLSNLQIGWQYKAELPKDLDEFETLSDLLMEISIAVDSGVTKFIEVSYAKTV